jgi:hypothetical protein
VRLLTWAPSLEGVTMALRGGPLRDASVRYAVESVGSGQTRVTYSAEGELHGALRFLTPFMPSVGRADAQRNLVSLERLVETTGR